MPTGCNRGFYYRPYCLLNMFRAPLYPSPGAQEYYTVVFRAVVFKLLVWCGAEGYVSGLQDAAASVPLTEYCAGGKIEKNEMGGACGAYRGGERGAQGSGGET